MNIKNYIPYNLTQKQLFWPGYFQTEFTIDYDFNLIVPENSSTEWTTGDRVFLSTDGSFPEELQLNSGQTYEVTSVNTESDYLQTSSSFWETGMKISLSALRELPAPLLKGNFYYVVNMPSYSTRIQLAESYSNAISGITINLLDEGSFGYLPEITVVNPVAYLIVSEANKPLMLADTYENAINYINLDITDTGRGHFYLTYYGSNPSVIDLLQWTLDVFGDISDVCNKYKDKTNYDIALELIKEYGYQYIIDVLQLNAIDIQKILQSLYVIHCAKGTKRGLEFILDQINIEYELKEWWEYDIGNSHRVPYTYTGDFYIHKDQEIQGDIMTRLVLFLRQYVYPICDLTLDVEIDFTSMVSSFGGFVDTEVVATWDASLGALSLDIFGHGFVPVGGSTPQDSPMFGYDRQDSTIAGYNKGRWK